MHGVEFTTVADVADALNVEPITVYRKVKRGELPPIKLGSARNAPLRTPTAAVKNYILEHAVAPARSRGSREAA